MEKKNQITEGVIWKQLLLFFFPIVFGTFFQQIYNTADTVVVGRFVGKEALAAVGGSVTQIVNLIVGFFVGLSSGAAVVISQFYGAGDEKNLHRTLHTAYAFSIIAGTVMGILGILISGPVLEFMKTPEEIMADSKIYLYIYFGGLVFNLIYNVGSSVLRAVGDSKRPLYVLIVTCILNIILDIVLVVYAHMGVMGVAVATVFSQAVSAFLVTAMLMKKGQIYQLHIGKIRLKRNALNRILNIGIPAGLESVMYSISNLVIQIFVNKLGTDTVAAWGTFAKIDAVFWMVINAFGIAITTFVGQNYGAGKHSRIKKGYSTSFRVISVWGLLIAIVFALFPVPIAGLFFHETEVIHIAKDYLIIIGLSEPFMCVELMTVGAISGLGKTKTASIITIILTAARIPLALLLSYIGLGLNGIWWALTISSIAKGIVFYFTFHRISQKF